MAKKRIIVIPAYEPKETMLSFLKEFQKEVSLFIVVDDGSGKKYAKIFEEAKQYAVVLTHEVNQGKGRALKTAFHYIAKHVPDAIIVTMDCDGQHTMQDAKKLISFVQKHEDTLVLGKRLRHQEVPLRSKIGNALTRFVFFLVTGVHLYDTQTGLRAFDSQFLPFLEQIPGERFEYEMNMLLYCAASEIPMTEVVISTIYIDNNKESHFHVLLDSYRIYKEMILFSSPFLLSVIIDFLLFFLTFSLMGKMLFSNVLSIFIALILYKLLLSKKRSFRRRESSLLLDLSLSMLLILGSTLLLDCFLLFQSNIYVCKLLTQILILLVTLFLRQMKNLTKKT